MAVPPGSTSNMSTLLDDVLDLGLLGDAAWAAATTWQLWAKATMARVSSGLSLLDGGDGGLLDALEAADAGAVFLVHGAADVEDQGEVEGERLAAPPPAGMSLTSA